MFRMLLQNADGGILKRGAVEDDDLYGPDGWCVADKPKFTYAPIPRKR